MSPVAPPLVSAVRPVERPVVVFDFDGTVCLGGGPVLAYAEAALARMDPVAARGVGAEFERWMQGESADHHPDAYVALASLARPVLGESSLSAAYLDSRRRLVGEDLGVRAPEGLTVLLEELAAAGCERVLLTNSPAIGMAETLERLGVRTAFDQVVVGARKPARMRAHLQELLGAQGPHRLASIGDNWANDVAPAIHLGAVGMLITGAWGESSLPPETAGAVRASRLEGLLPALRTFAADPETFETPAGAVR